MQERPLSVTIVGWVLIVFAILGVIAVAMSIGDARMEADMAASGVPPTSMYIVNLLGTAITLACGIGVLKGMNWARWLYVAWGTLSALAALAITPSPTLALISLAIVALIAFFLFRKPADAWFRRTPA